MITELYFPFFSLCEMPVGFLECFNNSISHSSVLVELRAQHCSRSIITDSNSRCCVIKWKVWQYKFQNQLREEEKIINKTIGLLLYYLPFHCLLINVCCILMPPSCIVFLRFITNSIHKIKNIIRAHAHVDTVAANNARITRC